MGLQADIGFVPRRANAVQRIMQKLASASLFSGFLARVLAPLDRLVYRLSKGRATLAGTAAALPIVLLTTTGARSGEPRTSPLNGIPLGDDIAVIGTRFGTGKIPSWAYNLRADPTASIEYKGSSFDVVAREADRVEFEAAFAAATKIYPGFAGYRERATNLIPVFILESASPKPPQ